MEKQKHLLAVMVVLPVFIAVGICVGVSATNIDQQNLYTGIAMIGLAALQLLVGLLVLGPRGLLSGYQPVKKQGQQ